jgi:GNAT superfamily N-acetyltransferase
MDAVVTALSDYPEFVPVVARWHWDEWGRDDPEGTLASWAAGLALQADADQIPGTLVAVAGGAPVGAVCLVETDMPGYEPVAALSPWIKGLYVEQQARRRGCAGLLMSRCESWAAALGHQVLYLYTERGSGAEQLYLRLGWQVFRHDQYDGMAVSVMRKSL